MMKSAPVMRRTVSGKPAETKAAPKADNKFMAGNSVRVTNPATGQKTSVKEAALQTLESRVETLQNAPKGEKTFSGLMAFDGALPEVINGRLAMVGFTAAMVSEVLTGESVVSQFSHESLPVFALAAAVVLGSVSPLLNSSKVTTGAKEMGPGFSITNELVNGRAAMVGFAILLGYELLTPGSSLFEWSLYL